MQEKLLEAFKSKMSMVSRKHEGSILDLEEDIQLMVEMNICRVVPMSSSDFVSLLSQKEAPFNEDGYLIENLMKKGNIEGFQGYISWIKKSDLEMIPIDERPYEEQPTFQLRLLNEKKELDEKIEKLAQFLLKIDAGTVTLESKANNLLRKQLIAMTDYQSILQERISSL